MAKKEFTTFKQKIEKFTVNFSKKASNA